MPWVQDDPKWVPDEYPKMRVTNGKPNVFPDGHPRSGELMIFDSADEEAEFDGPRKPPKKAKRDDE